MFLNDPHTPIEPGCVILAKLQLKQALNGTVI
jgi:hypothetical protein